MGIVYEAEQLSLGRRVALKVLPLASTLDPRHLQRFKNEAQAAAQLHHTNIVPVHFVGCDRGVHYYAMQFIEGHSLAEVINDLRAERGGQKQDSAATRSEPGFPRVPAGGAPGAAAPAGAQATHTDPAGQAETASTTPGSRLSRPAYFAWVARLGEQAALALEHAHQMGVLHRDIKPGNLLLDARDNLWVTDFGLAHLPGDQRLTVTGDLLGTLRYMSPEQVLARRIAVDQRTDVYALGVTLYELLTLQPAYSGKDRQELLQQIAFEEPRAPRRLDSTIPMELETIVLKAMAKAPTERYATAQELAEDLRHWLEDQPIKARRPPLWLRARRWGRRHRQVVAVGTTTLLVGLLAAAASVGWVVRDHATKRQAVSRVIEAALKDSADWQAKRRLSEALSAARRADGLLGGAAIEERLRERVQHRLADLVLVKKLENVRLEVGTRMKDYRYNWDGMDTAFRQTFQDAGLDVESLSAVDAAERIRDSDVAAELAIVLDYWALRRQRLRGADDPAGKHLLEIARLADPDPLRTQMRAALEGKGRGALRQMAASPKVLDQPSLTLVVLGDLLLDDPGARAQTEAFLRAAQRRHPDDFWLNFELAYLFKKRQRPAEALPFAAVAVGLRPDSPGAHLTLGYILWDQGKVDEAIFEYREAIRLNKDFLDAYDLLGVALDAKGQPEAAIAQLRQAIRIKKDAEAPHTNLAAALCNTGRYDEAIAEAREAIRLNKHVFQAHLVLGRALCEKGWLDEAIAECREVLHLQKDCGSAHRILGEVLARKWQPEQAMPEYREAIRLNRTDAQAHVDLGGVLRDKGQFSAAIAEYREAVRLRGNYAEAHYGLGRALQAQGDPDGALSCYRTALKLEPGLWGANANIGSVLLSKGNRSGALAAYRRVLAVQPAYIPAIQGLVQIHGSAAALEEVQAAWEKILQHKPLNHDAWHGYAELCLYLGKQDAYRRARRDLLAVFSQASDPMVGERTGRACLLLPAEGQEMTEAIALLHRAEKTGRRHVYYQFFRISEALGEYRCGRPAEAMALLKATTVTTPHRLLIEALALAQLGRRSEALRRFYQVLAATDWSPARAVSPDPWIAHVLRREAETVLVPDLNAWLAGTAYPRDDLEWEVFESICFVRREYAAGARRLAEALAAHPKMSGHRYNAACLAARAGEGAGPEAAR